MHTLSLQAHVSHFIASVDAGKTWELIPEEYIEENRINLRFFQDRTKKAHEEDEDCEDCLLKQSCSIPVEFMIQRIQYCLN